MKNKILNSLSQTIFCPEQLNTLAFKFYWNNTDCYKVSSLKLHQLVSAFYGTVELTSSHTGTSTGTGTGYYKCKKEKKFKIN